MQHGMTQLGILFPKGADDHAHFILPKEVERVLDHRGSTCTPPSISTGVKGDVDTGGKIISNLFLFYFI
jgi:hypothetical protein